MKNILAFFCILFASLSGTNGQVPNWVISEPYAGHVTSTSSVVCDIKGNILVSGDHYNGGIYLVKYNNHGAKAWEKHFSGFKDNHNLVVDKSGRIYWSINQCESCTMQIGNKVATGPSLLRFSEAGEIELIQKGWILPATFNSDNSAFVSGAFRDTLLLPEDVLLTTNNASAKYIGKMNSEGNFDWAISEEGGPIAIRCNNKNFLTTGYISKTITLGKDHRQVTLNEENGYNYQAKYNDRGELLWAKQLNSNLLTPDNLGNLLVFERNSDFLLLKKYDPSGNLLWERIKLKTTLQLGQMNSDIQGSIFVSGAFTGSLEVADTTIYGSANSYNFFLLKLDSAGSLKWIIQSQGPGAAGAKAISTDDNGYIYVTGDMYGEVTFGDQTLNEPEGGIFTLKIKDLDFTTPTEEKSQQPEGNLSLYPNPASGSFILEGNIAGAEIEIHDHLGRKIKSFDNIKENTLLIDLPAVHGLFYLRIIKGEAVEVKKVVIE